MSKDNLLNKIKDNTTAHPPTPDFTKEMKDGTGSEGDSGVYGGAGNGTTGSTEGHDSSLPTEGSAGSTFGVVLYHLKSKEGIVPKREYVTVFPPVTNDDLVVKEYTSEHQIKHNITDKELEIEALNRFRGEVQSQQSLAARGFGRR